MWCRHCKQDVPAVAPLADGAIHCARCQGELNRPAFASSVNDSGVGLDESSSKPVDPLRRMEQASAEHRYQEMRRRISSARRHATNAPRSLRFDPPEPLLERTSPTPARPANDATAHDRQTDRQNAPTQWAAWLVALFGASALGAGLGLMFWSIANAQPELWNWGLGATLGGQGLMIIGLVQLLVGLWTTNRRAVSTLIGVQHELRRLSRTTESLVGANSPTAANFYADLARGASPQLLVANLKSQVDALTAHVVRD